MAISKRLRYEILRRDNHTCRYCGRAAPAVALTVDHVLPTALGGDDAPQNLVAACADCNAGKASSNPDQPIVDQVSDDHIRWARAIKQASALMAEDLDAARRLNVEFDEIWAEELTDVMDREAWRDDDWSETLDNFRSRGLTQSTIIDALLRTINASHVSRNNRWRYFCGICWARLREVEDAARSLLAVEEADGGS